MVSSNAAEQSEADLLDTKSLRQKIVDDLGEAHEAASSSALHVFDLMEKEITSLRDHVADLEDDAEEENEDDPDLFKPINDLLDCVERPVGTLNATLPQTPQSERALIALFDAIGRTL